MTSNTNLMTGIAFGYISAHALDSDVVDSLMYGNGVSEFVDISAREYELEYRASNGLTDTDELPDDIWDDYQSDESIVTGTYEGVSYASSWLGGALNFFIFESPVITHKANLASPCVPNAGILDSLDGSVTCYDVPADWRANQESNNG